MANLVEVYIKKSKCKSCGQHGVYPKRRRMNTAYVDDELNYITECDDCFEATEKYWEEMWADYYSSTR